MVINSLLDCIIVADDRVVDLTDAGVFDYEAVDSLNSLLQRQITIIVIIGKLLADTDRLWDLLPVTLPWVWVGTLKVAWVHPDHFVSGLVVVRDYFVEVF